MDQLTNRTITRIVSVDDENSFPVIDTIDKLVDAIATGRRRAVRKLGEQDSRFTVAVSKRLELDDAEVEERIAELRPILLELVDAEKLVGKDYQKVAEVVYFGHEGKTAKRLKTPFSSQPPLEALSFGDWEKNGGDIVAGTSENSRLLLLLDERNELEGKSELNGRALLGKLWSEHSDRMAFIDTIILTSACAPEAEFDESKKLVNELRSGIASAEVRAKVRRAFVLSKERLDDDKIDQHFEMHLNRIEAADLRSELADLTKMALHDAVSDSLRWLEDMPLSEFHGSVFVSSENEGSAELDTLLRLVSIRQRGELEKQFGMSGPLQVAIAKMRGFSLAHLDPDYAKASHVELRALREQEFERSGKLLNSVLAPLSNGDVFRFTETTSEGAVDRLAILLANPCDLSLRADGLRKAKRGWLVPLRKDTRKALEAELKKSGEGAALRYKLYTGSEDDDVGYLFTNSSVDAIVLDILDLCWLNRDGGATLDPSTLGQLQDSILPSQKKRAEVLAERASQDRFRDIELFGTYYRHHRTGVEKATYGGHKLTAKVSYPIWRVFSLSPEFAAAALSSLSQSIARPAFGHDFVRVG